MWVGSSWQTASAVPGCHPKQSKKAAHSCLSVPGSFVFLPLNRVTRALNHSVLRTSPPSCPAHRVRVSRISLWFCAILRVSETPKYLKVPRGEGSSPLIIPIECLLHILDFLSIWILEPSWSAKGERVPSALLLSLSRWEVLRFCFITQAFHVPSGISRGAAAGLVQWAPSYFIGANS